MLIVLIKSVTWRRSSSDESALPCAALRSLKSGETVTSRVQGQTGHTVGAALT